MKIFSWVQNKLNGIQRNEKIPTRVSTNHHVEQEPEKKGEFSDWPEGLLTIGTFGNNDVPTQNPHIQLAQEEEDQSSSPDLLDFTQEEVGKLQKELTKLLKRKPSRRINSKDIIEHPLNKFLNCPSSLEVDRRICESFRTNLTDAEKEEDLDRTINVILGRCKDVCGEKGNNSIRKKLVSFLLKKMFVCTGGFFAGPSLRDSLSLSESRVEKLLRTMLHKKINPQSSRPSSMKRVLDESQERNNINEDQRRGKVNDGCTWVKTDSEYIVLEI